MIAPSSPGAVPTPPGGAAEGNPRRARPQLPTRVDQMRILTWFQCHLTLVTLVVSIIVAAILSTHDLSSVGADDPIERQLDHTAVLILALPATAILLAVTAALVRRGFAIAFPLVILCELAVLVDVGLAFRTGIVLSVVTLLLVVLGGWILSNLFRREVRAFLLRPSRPSR